MVLSAFREEVTMLSFEDAQTLEFAIGFVLLLGVILYAVLGGADFGGGVWDLLARGPVPRSSVR